LGTYGDEIAHISELQGSAPQDLLRWALRRFHPRIALASSFGAEDVVLIDMLVRIQPDARIVTLDTGRLHEETYDVMERVRRRYGVAIETFFPDREAVERLEREKGLYSFRDDIDSRKECCAIRKVEPLRRALAGLEAWITGLRREQAITRCRIRNVEFDEAFGILKLNPLTDWSESQVWDYVRRHDVPYNSLHDQGFPSIGCAPCTRAVRQGEDIRAGRWWWERPEQRECGLHADAPERVPAAAPASGGHGTSEPPLAAASAKLSGR
jgi:phosphoadenosine phosphosulfate reductase